MTFAKSVPRSGISDRWVTDVRTPRISQYHPIRRSEITTMPETALLLIAHGSRHSPANEDLLRMASRLAEHGEYRIVEPAFLELAEPDIKAGGDRCVDRGASRVLMIPYFLSSGVHL